MSGSLNHDSHRVGSADFMMILTCVLWGVGTVVCKNSIGPGPESFRVTLFNGFRFPIAAGLMFLTLGLTGRPVRIAAKHLPGLFMVSLFGVFLFNILFFAGLSRTTAANAGIIMAVIPLVILAVSFVLGIERPTKRLAAGVILGIAGVVLMNVRGGAVRVNGGDVLILVSTLSWAVYAIFGRKYMRLYTPLTVTAWIFLFTSLLYVPIVAYRFSSQSWATISTVNWLNFGFAAVGPLFVANTLYYASIHIIGPSRSGVYINLEPVVTLVVAYRVRHERITPFQIAGLAVVVAGVIVARFREN